MMAPTDRTSTGLPSCDETGETEALSGRLEDVGQDFDNESDFFRTEDPACLAVEPSRVGYFRQYLKDYFSHAFVPGMGTEAILAALGQHGRGGRWLDLGAGTSTLFWSLALDDVSEIWCCDVVPEALVVLNEFARSSRVPPCYQDVMTLLGKPASHVAEMRARLRTYVVFNALANWPSAMSEDRFDLITAFGTLGIAPNETAFAASVEQIARHLAPGGRAIGTEWIRSPDFIARDGHDNRYLDKPVLEACARSSGLSLLDGTRLPIGGDPLYDHILVWAFAAR